MNKKSSTWIEKVASITFILIVLFILYLIIPKSILNTGKEFYDKIWGNEEELVIDYNEVDDTAQASFDVMISKIRDCTNSRTSKPCLCSVNLNAFYSFYSLLLKEEGIEMINTRSTAKLHVKSAETPHMMCYMNENQEIETAESILFEKQGIPYISKTRLGWIKDAKLLINPTTHNLVRISDDKICWMLEKTSKSDLVACEIL